MSALKREVRQYVLDLLADPSAHVKPMLKDSVNLEWADRAAVQAALTELFALATASLNTAEANITPPDLQEINTDMQFVTIDGTRFVKIGSWHFDAFMRESASPASRLGLTIYAPNTNPHDEAGAAVDIFIDPKTLEVRVY